MQLILNRERHITQNKTLFVLHYSVVIEPQEQESFITFGAPELEGLFHASDETLTIDDLIHGEERQFELALSAQDFIEHLRTACRETIQHWQLAHTFTGRQVFQYSADGEEQFVPPDAIE